MPKTIVVAGTHSGVGKTTISTALMAAYRRRALTVQGFKVGPDFIDPSYHAAATGRPGRNLDGWMLDRPTVIEIFQRAASDADVAIIEGVMGLFDGASGRTEAGSTAETAKWLGVPVVLAIDASALARSAAAIVHGFETFDPNLNVVAVIANKVAGEKHYQYIRDAIESAPSRVVPVGWLKKEPAVAIPERHLGLFMAQEAASQGWLDKLVSWVEATVDLDRLLELSERTFPGGVRNTARRVRPARPPDLRIGVARDNAFCFYYQDNLDLLEDCGAEIVFWSPTHDPLPQGLNGLYFGGGYPELFARELSANVETKRAVREFIERGGHVYAECGGLMYLTNAIVDTGGNEYPMAGVFPTTCRMQERLAALGYIEVEGTGLNSILARGETVRGHQYRYSTIDPMPDSIRRAYELRKPGSDGQAALEGYMKNNCLASYVHLHFLSNPVFAERWVDQCRTGVMT